MPRREEPHPLARRLGRRIQQLYKAKGLTMEAFAVLCGIGKGHISNIVRGLTVIKIDTVERFANGLGVPIFVLFAWPETDAQHELAATVGQTPVEQCQQALSQIKRPSEPAS